MKGQEPTVGGNHGADGAGAVNGAGEKRRLPSNMSDCKTNAVRLTKKTWEALGTISGTDLSVMNAAAARVLARLIWAEHERLVARGDILL